MTIPTAKEFGTGTYQLLTYGYILTPEQEKIKFAELHVQAALKAAKQVGDEFEAHEEMNEAILSAYPLNLIQ